MTKMKIQGLMFDQKNAMAVVILTDEEEKEVFLFGLAYLKLKLSF